MNGQGVERQGRFGQALAPPGAATVAIATQEAPVQRGEWWFPMADDSR